MTFEEKMAKLVKELKKSAIASRNDSVYEALMLTSAIINSIDWKDDSANIQKRSNPRPISGWEDVYTVDQFVKEVSDGNLTNYDGYANYSDGTSVFDEVVNLDKIDLTYSHVVWYNK